MLPRHLNGTARRIPTIAPIARVAFRPVATPAATPRRVFSRSATRREQHHQPADDAHFLAAFLRENQPPQSAISYFQSQDWARPTIDNDAYEAVPFFSRHLIPKTGENSFFSKVVNTPTTIPHLLALQRKHLQPPSDQQDHSKETTDRLDPNATTTTTTTTTTTPPDLVCLMSLVPDLASHAGIIHGGFQCVLFDEIIRMLILLHYHRDCEPGPRDTHFTATMTTTYVAPVVAPSDVLVRAWLVRREGRKWSTKAEIVGAEGTVLTAAEALWVTAKRTA